MASSTYTGKITTAKALTVGSWTTIVDSDMPDVGDQSLILLYVNISGILLPGRQCGTLDVCAIRDGEKGGTDETALGDHAVAGRAKRSDGRYNFQAFIPRMWFLDRTPKGVAIESMRWAVRADRYSIASGTMTTRYGKAWDAE